MGDMELLNLDAFTLGSLGDLLTVITLARRNDISDITELENLLSEYIRTKAFKNNTYKDKGSQKPLEIRCIKCNQYARILSVNDSPGNQIHGNYRSCVMCYNPKCKHVEYHAVTVQKFIGEDK